MKFNYVNRYISKKLLRRGNCVTSNEKENFQKSEIVLYKSI